MRPNWSRLLPRKLTIPGVMKLKTLADVRAFIGHVPKARRELDTWRHVISKIEEAARGGDVAHAAVALRMVLSLENVPCRAG